MQDRRISRVLTTILLLVLATPAGAQVERVTIKVEEARCFS